MTGADWARLKDWFAQCTEGDAEAEARVLAEARRESPELAAELCALLVDHGRQKLQTRALLANPQSEEIAPRERIGPYRVLRELGRGGAGMVFLAERSDDVYHRQVAIKLLRFSGWDGNAGESLDRERRALAQLRHANIAALVDWGTTDDGVPWLCLEFVDGLPIDEYCRSAAVSIEGALDLFEQVCAAVIYAHQRLIVHGDLKPPNILVRTDGAVKLLDFGISRLIDAAPATLTIDRRFTPAYASPEQLRGEPILASTDVYGLGLLLYELLSGSRAFDGDTIRTAVRRVIEGDVRPPSEAPGLAPDRRRAIQGDLDGITVRAIESSPDRRYPSAEQLLADVRRYRRGYPVTARRPNAAYRIRKFVQRNKLAVSAAAVALLGMVGGTGLAVWKQREAERQRQVAEMRYHQVQDLAHEVIFDLHDAIRALPGAVEARRLLVRTGLQYLDSLNASGGADDSLQMELAASYYRMGYAQGGLSGMNLGDTVSARQSYAKALHILDEQWRRHRGDLAIGALQNAVVLNYALSLNDPARGIAVASPYAASADRWMRESPGTTSLSATELLHQTLGRLRYRTGELDLALAELDRSIEDDNRLLAMAPDQPDNPHMAPPGAARPGVMHQVALTQGARASVLLDMGRLPESLAAVAGMERNEEPSLRDEPQNPVVLRVLYTAHGLRSLALLQMGRAREGAAEARLELRGAQALLQTQGPFPMPLRDVSQAQRHLGSALTGSDPVAAATLLEQAAKGIARVADADPGFLWNRILQAGTLNEYGLALLRSGQRDHAGAAFTEALKISEAAAIEAPSWIDPVRERAVSESWLGQANCVAEWAELAKRSPLRYPAPQMESACRQMNTPER